MEHLFANFSALNVIVDIEISPIINVDSAGEARLRILCIVCNLTFLSRRAYDEFIALEILKI